MSSSPIIRLAETADRDAILAFIRQMGFNPRDAVSWDSLHMTAMTAWAGSRLIGAIPLEPRQLIVGTSLIQTVHETVVAVEASQQNAGIGSRMQVEIARLQPCGAAVASVFREDPQSPAYRWYLKNGFRPVMHIESWFHDQPNALANAQTVELYDAENAPWAALSTIWQRSLYAGVGGLVDRKWRPISEWLAVHPYRHRYRFHIAVHRDVAGSATSYAILGIGQMHSQTERVEILELATITGAGEVTALIKQIALVAAKRGWHPIRWPLAVNDPYTEVARSLGFAPRWAFDMLIRPLDGRQMDERSFEHWRYAGIDYI